MIELTLEMAERATRAAREKANALGTPMTITVGGGAAVFLQPARPRAKAMAAANFRMSTADLAERVAKGAPFWTHVGSVLPGQILPSHGAVPSAVEGRGVGA